MAKLNSTERAAQHMLGNMRAWHETNKDDGEILAFWHGMVWANIYTLEQLRTPLAIARAIARVMPTNDDSRSFDALTAVIVDRKSFGYSKALVQAHNLCERQRLTTDRIHDIV